MLLLGEEPATDFRGMGMLGLDALSYVGQHHKELVAQILRPRDDKFFYFFAIGGINIASTVLGCVSGGAGPTAGSLAPSSAAGRPP